MSSFIRLIILTLILSSCSTNRKQTETKNQNGTDFHMHIHSLPVDDEDDVQFNAQRALFAADSIDLKRAVVLSNAYSKNVTEAYAKSQNDYVASEAAKDPARLAAACAINPQKNWAWREIKRCSSLKLKILKLHFMASGLDLRLKKDYEIAKSAIKNAELYKMTVLVHANYPRATRPGEIERLKDLIQEFPNTRWIIAHLFGREFEVLKTINHPHFFVEISIVPVWMKTEEQKLKLVEVMRSVGMHKFLFGSDWPVIHPAETLKALKQLPLSSQEKDAIVYFNGRSLNDLFQ